MFIFLPVTNKLCNVLFYNSVQYESAPHDFQDFTGVS